MASSGNFCTLNPLTQPNSGTFSEGNLLFTHTSGAWRTTAGTMSMTTGKWYWEAYQYEDLVGNGFPCGIYDMDSGLFVKQMAGDYPGQSSSSQGANYSCYTNSGSYAQKRYNGTTLSMTIDDGDSGDVWQCAFDADAGKIWFGKNNTWDNNANPALGSNESYASISSSKWAPITCSYNDSNSENYPQNFGQDDTFAGRITAQGNTDDNGHGVFKYAPPTGFLALCSANLPISDDIDPAQTDNDYPSKQFNAITYTGTGSSNAITGVGFQPDFVWFKKRNSTSNSNNRMVDSSRGVTKSVTANSMAAEGTDTNGLTAFGSDGFTVGADENYNQSSDTYVAWCWRANGGTTASNSSGTITSTVQANQAAGFSIVTYTGGNGAWGASNQDTFGHGLSQAPELIMIKERTVTDQWSVLHASMGAGGGSTPADNLLVLNSDAALYTNQSYKAFGGVMPTNTLVTVEGNTTNNPAGHVAYCWHSVEGYSKFGSYEGNGNADGPFVYTGFRPALFFVKPLVSNPWRVFDDKRNGFNPDNLSLAWDANYADDNSYDIDILSNGFKVRGSNNATNQDGTTFVYGAWGSVPFKYNNTF